MGEAMKCPKCGGECDRDEVDIGVGVQGGPWGCPDCHWVEGGYHSNDDREPPEPDGEAFRGGEAAAYEREQMAGYQRQK
jgi:hypothetical protein